MSALLNLKPTHRAVRGHYLALVQSANVGARHESAVRAAFHQLIEACAGPLHWTLVREYELHRKGEAALRRAAINPALADSAIEEMLIQHRLTARLFASVYRY